MRRLHLLDEFPAAHNHRVIAIDPTPQIFPCAGLWPRKIEVAAPDPRTFFFVMPDQRKRLRIVHDHKIVVQEIAHAVLVNHLFINFLFDAGQVDLGALERVVHFLCDRKEIRRSLNDAPFSAQTEAVPQQCQRGEHLRHAAAIVSGIEIRHAQPL